MRTVFADSFYFFALENEQDAAHTKAVTFLQTYRGQILTTGWIVTEVGDGFADPVNRSAFLLTVDTLRAEPNVRIVACSDELLDAGIALYRQRPDKGWSLTDCISFVVMTREGVTEALTGDHHFEPAGFIALLK
jgi:predicted nucleic acid-binding protein